MDEAGAGPYTHLHMFMMLKHFKTGRCGTVIGWGNNNGDPYLHLYFADREPADKTASRSKCYEWRRLSAFVPMNEPLVKENVLKPDASKGGEQGDAAASSTNVAMQHDAAEEPAKNKGSVEVDLLKANDESLADDDFIFFEEFLIEDAKDGDHNGRK